MQIRANLRKTTLALFACATLALSIPARADVVAILDPDGFLFPPPQYFGLATGIASQGTPSTGAFVGTFDGVPLVFFCVELNQYFTFANTYQYTETLPDDDVDARFAQLGRLFTARFDSIVDSPSSAAFQLAVWEIFFDTDLSLTNVAGFHVTGGPSATVTMAQEWLDQLGNSPDAYDVYLLDNRSHQNFVTGTPIPQFAPPPLPEPATLMLVGIGVLAMLTVNRRRTLRALR